MPPGPPVTTSRTLGSVWRPSASAQAYAIYLRRLRAEVARQPVPPHVAIIMDGNRRWAAQAGHTDPGFGHRASTEKTIELVDWCADAGVREVTLWALSLENLARPEDEVGTITGVATDALGALASGRRWTRAPTAAPGHRPP